MADPRKKPRHQPTYNVFAHIEGDTGSPWIRLRSASIGLGAVIDNLNALLTRIDAGLEIVTTDKPAEICVQPKHGVMRTRPQLFIATRQLAQTQGWLVKWND